MIVSKWLYLNFLFFIQIKVDGFLNNFCLKFFRWIFFISEQFSSAANRSGESCIFPMWEAAISVFMRQLSSAFVTCGWMVSASQSLPMENAKHICRNCRFISALSKRGCAWSKVCLASQSLLNQCVLVGWLVPWFAAFCFLRRKIYPWERSLDEGSIGHMTFSGFSFFFSCVISRSKL